MRPIRLTVVMTHPVQYYSPWFRYVTSHAPDIDLTVLYATEPTAAQQGSGFGHAFTWDVPLRDGYRSQVLRPARPRDRVDSESFFGVDAHAIGRALRATQPDVVLIPGWHSITLVRAMFAARRLGVPLLFRGDTNLASAPSGWMHRLWRPKTKYLLSQFDGFLSPGQRVRAYLEHMGVDSWQITDTPHCVDNERFATAATPHQSVQGRATARGRWGLAADACVLLFAGKLEAKKRPLDVIRAAARLQRRAVVLIVGAGPLESACRAEALRLGVQTIFAGFLNQSELAAAYAAADLLVLPSDARETWGLVVNEALATGLPVVVSDAVGCAPDLVDDETGATFACGNVDALTVAIDRVRRRASTRSYGESCRARAKRFDFEAATAGLVKSCRLAARVPIGAPRVVACCGNMVTVTGLERMAFTVLRTLGQRGARLHCIVNSWENHRIVSLAEGVGATWSEGGHEGTITRRTLSPRRIVAMLRDVHVSSASLWRAARRVRATHVLLPDHLAPIRNLFALARLRARGVRVIMKLANAPDQGPFYRWYWRRLVNPLVSQFVCNSEFTRGELLALGVPVRKTIRIYNTLPQGFEASQAALPAQPQRGRVVYVGQVIPGKGLDLLVEAVALLNARGVTATLAVAGDIEGWTAPEYRPFREALRARSQKSDLADRVTFLGWCDDVRRLMSTADVHCAPSRPELREGFGLVNLEAKQAGVPSVVFKSGAFPEVVTHQRDGWVCSDVSADGLAEGLAYFLTDASKRASAGAAARESLVRFDLGSFTESWWNVVSPSIQSHEPLAAIERRVASEEVVQ